jgi:predicted dehydrogenase
MPSPTPSSHASHKSPSSLRTSRRSFLLSSAASLTGAFLAAQPSFSRAATRALGPSDKLRLGIVGVAGRGGENLRAVTSEDIVALCDVDQVRLDAAAQQFPQAGTYRDYRKMLERNDLDAVVISTPDHVHAVAIRATLESGRHVYCEKPLTHTVSEARRIAELTRQHKLVTQMGNQIHSGRNYRRVVELIQSGALGEVREAHHWVDGTWDPRPRPEPDPVPPHLDWDLWLGPVPFRDYSEQYVPFNWRRWWAFGGGTLADFCCHHIDLSLWALQLGRPERIEAEGAEAHPECAPAALVVHYDFPSRTVPGRDGTPRSLPPVRLTWHQGGKRPPQFAQVPLPKWGNGSLFVGSKGMLLADYDRLLLLPETDFAGFTPPTPWIEDSPGQQAEWIRAIKGGTPTLCHFEYGALLTEIGLLGNVAHRTGQPIRWDGKTLRTPQTPAAETFIQHTYRAGWSL